MDLFDYAQALFNEQGNLWIPALGHFFKVRKSSYYDAETNTMHPPGYVVGFTERSDNTDTDLIAYFSKVKNLSQGSAKYFVDKFVENIKDELQHREVTFALLGTLYTDANSQIAFRGNELNSLGDGGLYGLAPVRIPKLTQADEIHDEPVEEKITAIGEETETPLTVEGEERSLGNDVEIDDTQEPDLVGTAGVTPKKRTYDPNNFYTDDRVLVLKGKPRHAERSTRYQFWILAGLVALVVLLGIYLITQNLLDPENSSDVSSQVMTKGGGRKDTVVNANASIAKADTTSLIKETPKTLPAAIDTSSIDNPLSTDPGAGKQAAPDANSKLTAGIPKNSWIVFGGQNNNYDAAMRTLNKFREMGYAEARMIDSVKKKDYFVYKIIFGYYDTQKEAAAARTLLLKENKLKPKVLKVQQYK